VCLCKPRGGTPPTPRRDGRAEAAPGNSNSAAARGPNEGVRGAKEAERPEKSPDVPEGAGGGAAAELGSGPASRRGISGKGDAVEI